MFIKVFPRNKVTLLPVKQKSEANENPFGLDCGHEDRAWMKKHKHQLLWNLVEKE